MKILYYNWCPLQESEGGGIAIYQRNLLQYLANGVSAEVHSQHIECYFLCSGFYFDGKRIPYIREEETQYKTRVFSLVNSTVYAPMRAPEDNFQQMINDETVPEIIDKFLETYGPFDVIHFQTMEGLPLKVLALKERHRDTRFVYSVHNYTAICPNVMLWTEEGQNCYVHKGDCSNCMVRYNRPSTSVLKCSRRLLEKKHNKLYYYTRGIKFVSRKYFPIRHVVDEDVYCCYIRESIHGLNAYVDIILAVSERVRDIVIGYGVEARKVRVCYIGTRFAENALGRCLTAPEVDPFGIVYMGYMREEKGFYFLLEALEKFETNT